MVVLGLVVLGIDQVSKLLVRQNLNPEIGPGQIDVIGSWLRFTYVTNSGAVFGIFPDATVFFSVVALLAIPALILCQRYLPVNGWPTWVSIGMMLGGTAGNLVDRLRFGYVIDFIDAGIGNVRWYTWNVADGAYVVGVLLLATYLLFFVDTPRADTDNAT